MGMPDSRIANISGNTSKNSHRSLFGGQGRFSVRSLTPILLMILLLPISHASGRLSCSRLPMLVERLLSNLYAMKNRTEEIKTQAVDQMIRGLDPSKTLLYESDLGNIKPVLHGVFAGRQEGKCAPLQEVYDLLVARAHENELIVKKILGPDYRRDETGELNLNRRLPDS
jgi:carboxyl-terminal processing protease